MTDAAKEEVHAKTRALSPRSLSDTRLDLQRILYNAQTVELLKQFMAEVRSIPSPHHSVIMINAGCTMQGAFVGKFTLHPGSRSPARVDIRTQRPQDSDRDTGHIHTSQVTARDQHHRFACHAPSSINQPTHPPGENRTDCLSRIDAFLTSGGDNWESIFTATRRQITNIILADIMPRFYASSHGHQAIHLINNS